MREFKIVKALLLCIVSISVLSAQNINISGKIKDYNGTPIKGAEVFIDDENKTFSDSVGEYILSVPARKEVSVNVIHDNYRYISKTISASQSDVTVNFELQPPKETEIKEIVFRGTKKSSDLTSVKIDAEDIQLMPSLTGGVEDILKTLPFVSTNSELSSQYMVRGGNFDENLVYINGVEVYKPFLIRNGQQEGMSIINPDMVSMINFSAGGFEAGYGDKMSSVLDIIYRRPKKPEASLEASLLGGGVTLGFADKKQKFSGIIGGRYRNTDLVLKTLDGDTNFNPEYFDVQTYLRYDFSKKWNLSFLGNYSANYFKMVPNKSEVEFGTLNQPIKLTVFYNGQEKDRFRTLNNTLSLQFQPEDKWTFGLDGYIFQSKEQEHFDIASAYRIQDFDIPTGGTMPTFDISEQLDHARNDLDMLVAGAQLKAKYKLNVNSTFDAGIHYQNEDIRDMRNEWQLISLAGFSNPRPELPPGDLDEGDLNLNYHILGKNNLNTNRVSGFLQYTTKFMWADTRVFINTGIRATNWDFNGETNISPRAQIAVKPNWEMDMLFRFATGLYYQPPFYKEIRFLDGTLNKNIKSQRSIHFILGNDYEFKLFDDRPFKLTTELYYKKLDDLIPYYVNNVRVIYTGENNSKGYAYGIDARLNGEFVPGAESWISLSYARTKENIDGRGYLSRPTDQRFRLGLFFQDYMKLYPQIKASVNLVYASGLPNGAPLFTDPYQYQSKLSDYKRADVGVTYVFVDQVMNKARKGSYLSKFNELSLGLEIFNVFDIRNTVSNQWVRDSGNSVSYAVPNKLTGRFFNVKLNMKL